MRPQLRSLFALAIVGLGLGGCIGPFNKEPTLTYHADVRFTTDERKCISESTEQWRSQTAGTADADVVYDYNPGKVSDVIEFKGRDRLVRWTSEDTEVKALDGPDHSFYLLGLASGKITDPVRLPIEVHLVADRFATVDGYSAQICKLTTIHELGHAFGLPHLGRKTDIMYPSVIYQRSACLKHEDLFAFGILNKVPMGVMKPCPDDPDFFFEDTDIDEPPAVPGGFWMAADHAGKTL